ncbi:MAG: AmmeMemoRadiSam system radical SAM enzyme [Candidatus Woesearchaeota archaeon]
MDNQKEKFYPIKKYYTHTAQGIQCMLCPHHCIIPDGKSGLCKTRINIRNKFYSIVYNRPCAIHDDPIEKKPFYHFFPGSRVLSVGTLGCNLFCQGCQNFEISRIANIHDASRICEVTPKEIIAKAHKEKYESIAYTYTEPTIFLEYMIAIAKLAKKRGIKNVIVSNGYIEEEPLKELLKYIDAANIDLKGFTESFYKKYCGATLAPVLRTIKQIHEHNIKSKKKCWLELTNLIIQGLNDDPQDIKNMCEWIIKTLGTDVPLHFSRFYPYDRAGNIPMTPISTLLRAKEIAERAGIKYVYIGNVSDPKLQHTYCPNCKALLIKREGYHVEIAGMKKNKCRECGKKITGDFLKSCKKILI